MPSAARQTRGRMMTRQAHTAVCSCWHPQPPPAVVKGQLLKNREECTCIVLRVPRGYQFTFFG